MLKTICKIVVWMAIPLGLAVGCAANRAPTEAAYSSSSGAALTPTSGEPEQRIYSSTEPIAAGSSASMEAAPRGADPQNWNVAEAIQQKLLQDKSLAPLGSSLIAEVNKDGVVTLKGRVSSPSEKERVRATLASVPGVTGVNDDQLGIGQAAGVGTLDMR